MLRAIEQALCKLARVLDGELDEDAVLFGAVADGVAVQRRLALVEVHDEVVQAAVEFIVDDDGMLVLGDALVDEVDLQPLIQKRQLFEPLGDGFEVEHDGIEHFGIRLEADEGARLVRLFLRVAQVLVGHAAHELPRLFVVVGAERHLIDRLAVYFDAQPLGKGVGDGCAHAVQAARKGIVVLVELAARVQLCKDDLHARNARLGVDVGGDAAAVVLYRGAAVLVQLYLDAVGKAVGRLVDGVVDDLPQDMMQALDARRTDVHAGAQAHRVQPFEDLYVLGIIVILLFRHKNLFLFKKCVPICDIVPYFALFFKEIGGGNTIFRSSAAWFSEAAPFRAKASSSPHARRTLLLARRFRSSAYTHPRVPITSHRLMRPSRIDPAPPLYAHLRRKKAPCLPRPSVSAAPFLRRLRKPREKS